MRIGIDTHFVTSASATGNRTYTIEMVNALLELDSCNEYILYAVDENSFYKALADKPNVHVRYVLHPNGLIRNFVSLPRAVAEDRLEVALLQFIMAPYTSVPVVLTIHDLHYVHMQQPSFYEWGIGKLTGWSAHRADHIITLSMYSRRDILRTYALSGDQVTAINAAVNTRFQPMSNHVRLASVKMNCGIDRNYILYVGRTEDPRKNISTLIDAYTKLRQEQKITEQLVIAGRHGPGTAALQEKIHATNSQRDILLPGIISDEDLPILMSGASVFAYAPSFEGFGLPVLEALSCGTPVITSNITSLPEVAGEAAIYVSPGDVENMQSALYLVLSQSSLRARMRLAGIAQASRFSWQETARQTLQILECVAKSSGSTGFHVVDK